MNTPDEQWRPCPGFLRYEVSNHGRFRNARTRRIVTKKINVRDHYQFLKLYPNVGRGSRTVRTAPLIAAAWLGERPAGTQIDHKNGKQNEGVDDLEYVTQEVNIQRSYDRGGRKTGKLNILTEADHDRIKELWTTKQYSQVTIAKMIGCTNSAVSRIVNGKSRPRRVGRVRERSLIKQRLDAQLEIARQHLSNGPISSYKLAKLMGVRQSTVLNYIWRLNGKPKRETADDSAATPPSGHGEGPVPAPL